MVEQVIIAPISIDDLMRMDAERLTEEVKQAVSIEKDTLPFFVNFLQQ